ncbi:hypothetical protein SAMD00019534_009100 [Acytostelium subglobosum LB1]|uniref:hypothetical protein n=1 Tax=Acytostelium subglobosum LB1 TaxID=1410327 RepID=UPI0006447B1F|nr:hypothetical protein SAMD00019534_009100 [Acytostelium subglobosum LB1]GAM17735.1 hypothetical protein SAMD00019534_009100 [Acytostelium subglobosum LB1]|eukprot:XP_012758331.1 hypothetical protein SAMD00019534_009100 [Acytostelium subglobosum LB1]
MPLITTQSSSSSSSSGQLDITTDSIDTSPAATKLAPSPKLKSCYQDKASPQIPSPSPIPTQSQSTINNSNSSTKLKRLSSTLVGTLEQGGTTTVSKKKLMTSSSHSQTTAMSTSFEADPSTLQFIQTAVQLIYKSRSNALSYQQPLVDVDLSHLLSNNDRFPVSRNVTLEDLHEYRSKDLDIFECRKNETGDTYKHVLLERWIFTFKPKPAEHQPSIERSVKERELTISDELSGLMVPINDTGIHVGSQSGTLSPKEGVDDEQNYSHECPVLKCLYYTLSSMPLFSSIKYMQQHTEIGLKVKYGASKHFPPPANFDPLDCKLS